jgi:hypothetical protein
MKNISIALTLLATVCYADNTDDIARGAIRNSAFYDNGLDQSPEGQRQSILNNSNFALAVYMESAEVPERVRLAYALRCLKEQLRGSIAKANGSAILVVDEIATAKMREQVATQIALLERRYVEIHLASQSKDSAEAGTGQPATRPESKSEGSDKPQPESEGRSR